MKNLKEFLLEAFNTKYHEKLKADFEKNVGKCWDAFVKKCLPLVKKHEEDLAWNEISFYEAITEETDLENIAKEINCNYKKLNNFIQNYDSELTFTFNEFIAYKQTI